MNKNKYKLVLIGPPCAGKTTISKSLVLKFGCKALSLDTQIARKKNDISLKTGDRLSDYQIDVVVDSLLCAMENTSSNCVFELPYHDYGSLFSKITDKLKSELQIIILTANLTILLERNLVRPAINQIPEDYIDRCFRSTEEFKKISLSENFKSLLFFDTFRMSKEEVFCKIIEEIFDKKEGG